MKAKLIFLKKGKTDRKEVAKSTMAMRDAFSGVSYNSWMSFFMDEFPKAAFKNIFEEDLSLILP